MRRFNTSGPCNPDEHYMVMRPALIAEGLEKIRSGRYLTIFAPRQTGKTTFFQLLIEELQKEGKYMPIWISFEDLQDTPKKEFYEVLGHELSAELAERGIQFNRPITSPVTLSRFFEELRRQCPAMVLVIDEFEGVSKQALDGLLHSFRKVYHKRERHALHSLILVGVSTLADLIVSSASPFNITDELEISFFSFDEVNDLIGQYTQESGQKFEAQVIRAIYENSAGQPGLVNGLCAHLVEQAASDRTKPVTMDDFYPALNYFLTQRFDKNIINIVQKARRRTALMLRLLFTDTPISFTVDDPDIASLYAHGVIDSIAGRVEVAVPLYKKRLINAFRPPVNGESDYYDASSNFSQYLSGDGLNMKAILQQYVEYVSKRGFRAFDTKQLREGAWHYSLDGFINFFIERLGGQTFTEVPSGRGRIDLLILFRGKKYVIETKRFTDQHYFEKGKHQLAEYLKTEGLEIGYYIVFSQKHAKGETLEAEEIIDGKRIVTRIIRVNFERPSRSRKKRS